MIEPIHTCNDCVYFEKYGVTDYGCCHRHAPMPRINDINPKCWPSLHEGPFTQWPTVDGDIDWCGDIKLEDK